MGPTEKRALLEALTNIGVHVLPLWWVKPDGSCACGTSCQGNAGKHPLVSLHWADKATTDMRRVDNLLSSYPDCNWGVLTGVRSGIFIVDVDAKGDGQKTLDGMVAKHGPVPQTMQVATGGGGTHYYFRMPKDTIISSRVGVFQGIDIRGEGNSQAVAPPSVHKSGVEYTWVHGPTDGIRPADAPPWLSEAILKEQGKASKSHTNLGGVAKLGTRDDALFYNAMTLLKQGIDPELAVNSVWAWVQSGGVEQTPQDVIDRAYVEAKVKAAQDFLHRGDPHGTADGIRQSLNDWGNARRVYPKLVGRVLHCTGVGWLVWNGRVWYQDQNMKVVTRVASNMLDSELRNELAASPRTAIAELGRWLQHSMNYGKVMPMLKFLEGFDGVNAEIESFDQDPMLLNFTNGTLNLSTGELRDHDQADRITIMLPYDYDPEAECPTWERTIDLAFQGQPELKEYVQRAFGYSLTGVTAEQCFFLAVGVTTENGKSTLLDNFYKVLGPYAGNISADILTADRTGNAAMAALAACRGKRFVMVSEVGGTINEELIKLITGGDPLLARFLRENPFTFFPEFKVWMMTNEPPNIRSDTPAIWRRVKRVEFNYRITGSERRDRNDIDAEIQAQRQGVIAWAVRGCNAWVRGKLGEPDVVRMEVERYREEQNTVTIFLTEEYEVAGRDARLYAGEVYEAFVNWCRRSGIRSTPSRSSFIRRVGKYSPDKVTVGDRSTKFSITGLKRRMVTIGPEDML